MQRERVSSDSEEVTRGDAAASEQADAAEGASEGESSKKKKKKKHKKMKVG